MRAAISNQTLEMIKTEAGELERLFRESPSSAKARAQGVGVIVGANLPHSMALDIVAREWGGVNYLHVCNDQKLRMNYYNHALAAGYWPCVYSKAYSGNLAKLRIAALEEAVARNIPLSVCARKRNVDFDGFEFSDLLSSRIFGSLICINFSGLRARNCILEGGFGRRITSFTNADLQGVRFFNTDGEGVSGPGATYGQIDFSGADLTGADLRNMYFSYCTFYKAILTDADLRNSHTSSSCFDEAVGDFKKGLALDNSSWLVEKKHKYLTRT